MVIRKKGICVLAVLAVFAWLLISNPMVTHADGSVIKVNDTEYTDLVSALKAAKALVRSSDSNPMVIVDLCGNSFSLNEEFSFEDDNYVHIENGSIVLNAPLKAINGACITLCSLDLELNCNNALQSIGDLENGKSSLIALTTNDKDTVITGKSSYHAMIRLEDYGRCVISAMNHKVNITNSTYDVVFDIVSGQLVSNSGLVLSSLNNGIEVSNPLNSKMTLLNLMKDTTVYSGNTAIKVVGDSTEQPTTVYIYGGDYLAKTTLLDVSGNSVVDMNTRMALSDNNASVTLKASSANTTVKVNGGQLKTNGSIYYEKLTFELNNNADCYLTGLGNIKNVKLIGNNNKLRLMGKNVFYDNISDSGTDNTLIISHGIFENIPQTILSNINTSRYIIKMDGSYYLGDSVTEFTANRIWKNGDTITVISYTYTLPEVEGMSWYDSKNQACTSHQSSEPKTYTLLDKPCEHIISYVAEVEPDCSNTGHIGYYSCSKCNALFADSKATKSIALEDTVIPVTDHLWGEWTVVTPATEDTEGLEERVCKNYRTHVEQRTIPKLSHVHKFAEHKGQEPSCTEDGTRTYYECTLCGKLFGEDKKTEISVEDTVIKAKGHTLTHVEAAEPTFEKAGNIEYWTCNECKSCFKDSDGKRLVSKEDVIIAPLTKKDIIQCYISMPDDCAWTGSPVTPKITVKDGTKTLEQGKDYTVTYSNNTKSGMGSIEVKGIGDYTGSESMGFRIKKVNLRYRAYVQKHNWMSWSNAEVGQKTNQTKFAGTTDNLRMETIQMQLSGIDGFVRYRAYCAKKGWTQWATTADTTTYAGTKGESRRVEMIQLQSKGQVAELYNMYYRTYCEKFGWLGWAGNNQKSGSAGYARKLEAFQVQFVPKGMKFDKGTKKAFYDVSKDGANPK